MFSTWMLIIAIYASSSTPVIWPIRFETKAECYQKADEIRKEATERKGFPYMNGICVANN